MSDGKAKWFLASENDKVYTGLMSEATTPIITEIKRYELEFGHHFNNLGRVKFIPFLDGGDATVQFLGNMAATTPTLGSCNNLYMRYLGRVLTVKKKSGHFDLEEEAQVISLQDKKDYTNFLSEFLGGEKGMVELKKAIQKAASNILVYGNACIEIIRRSKGKAKAARIKPLNFTNFRYENTVKDEDLGNWAIKCEDFMRVNYDYNIPYQRYAVFPNFSTFDDGTERSILHIKNEVGDGEWYGLPYSTPALYSQFLEYQVLKFNSLAFNKKLLPEVVLFRPVTTYAMDENTEDIKEKIQRFNRKYTANASQDAREVLGMLDIEYPEKGTPPTIEQLKPTADTKYFEFVSSDSSSKIRSACGVNEILLEKGGNNLSGGNALYQAALAFYSVQVTDFKEQVLPLFNDAIKDLLDWFGYDNKNDLVLDLKKPEFLETFASFSDQKNSQQSVNIAQPKAPEQPKPADTNTGDPI